MTDNLYFALNENRSFPHGITQEANSGFHHNRSIATIFDAAIDRRIGALPMDRIDGALRHTLGLA
ncbi:MAG: hypothetical protein R3E79_31460 [Caldilineaceae bacterium]